MFWQGNLVNLTKICGVYGVQKRLKSISRNYIFVRSCFCKTFVKELFNFGIVTVANIFFPDPIKMDSNIIIMYTGILKQVAQS